MRTSTYEPSALSATLAAAPAAIVALASQLPPGEDGPDAAIGDPSGEPAGGSALARELQRLQRARDFALPLLQGRRFDTGEEALAHADGVAQILAAVGAAPAMQAAVYLVYAGDFLTDPETLVTQQFGASYASLVTHTRQLVKIQRNARDALADETDPEVLRLQLERVRKMLLAFSRDLRVVLLRLASRLQTLRFYAATKTPCPRALARETQQVFAPLASRLGIWQIKWELEDLSFRFLQPDEYRRIARLLDEKRVEREQGIAAAQARLAEQLMLAGVRAEVQGRPKHIYSIWKKMQGKNLDFSRVFDVRALRVIVEDVPACYAALSRVHELWTPLPEEFDDYIARPKPNGYQSLHTIVHDAQGKPLEIQIRTRAMHEHAESGVAAHWAYKEAGSKGYAGVSAAGDFEERVAQARRAVLQQLLAWERDFAGASAAEGEAQGVPQGLFEDRIYVFTPQATVIELPAGATAIDFAYTLHTDLGHRCRGARIDGALQPLSTPLRSGQTVEINAAKEGGPSLDWLNPHLGFVRSHRARAKVRAWFNARALNDTIARGREAVEKLLQREGRTALKLDELAAQLGFRNAEALFEVVGKDEYSLRRIEELLRPPEPPAEEALPAIKRSRAGEGGSGVLVVGVESLLTQLARCCRPAPPDAIGGYVTRGKGVAVHRADCANFRQLVARSPERVIPVTWGTQANDGRQPLYPIDVSVLAQDRQGLLRDVSEVFAKDKVNVTGVNTRSVKGTAFMTFTVEVADAGRLSQVLAQVARVPGVQSVRRR
ncbi:RelA/SpoT family protein [Sphaerotilus microaerophilus]|uniref:GTP pyrophosphokinase n=1 Tax=Sphaerotilus microaerophilus TaxID=2914710 RepID=A0ABM7YML0_9BURK|nr:bifunctional (p)ppGpp synthetase/guanosine-3',5'-bis(diphosphate) 3'-pyrophosphohydrolase [Sphaerotilus sp. FB-5]BDI05703.1 GTP pyrophosphokinase [Sphaerotilus sp. FB-5]